MNRHVTIALAASVVLNMLLAGMVLGDLSSKFVTPAPAAFDTQAQLAKLPPDKRALFDNMLGPAIKTMDTEHAQLDEGKKEALRILNTEPFDAAAYMATVQRMNDLHVQMKLHISQAVVEVAKQMTQQERGIIAEIISHPPFSMPAGTLRLSPPSNTGR